MSGNCLSDGLILGFSLYAAGEFGERIIRVVGFLFPHDRLTLNASAIVFSAFVDLYLSIYPSIVLYRLQLPRKKKIYLSIALGLGLV